MGCAINELAAGVVKTTTATFPPGRKARRIATSAFAGSKEHQAETTDDGIEALSGNVKVFGGASQRRDIGQTSGAGVLPHVMQHRVGNVTRDHMSLCANPAGSQQRLASRATAEVEHSGTDVDPTQGEHGFCGRRHPGGDSCFPACPTGGRAFPLRTDVRLLHVFPSRSSS
jgi:hypothetical protein